MKGRRPPYSADAELAVLGAMFSNRPAIAEAHRLVVPNDFYVLSHRKVFEAIVGCWESGHTADPVTVAEALRANDDLEEVGGKDRLVEIAEGMPAAASIRAYCEIVVGHASLRKLIAAAGAIEDMAYEGETARRGGLERRTDVRDVLDRSRALVESADLPPFDINPDPGLDAFLGDEPQEGDIQYLIRGLLAHQQRIMLVMEPGGGKSTLLRQWAVQASQGIHPWALREIDPIRVLLIELETPEHMVRHSLRPMRATARGLVGERYDDRRLRVIVRENGLDLLGRGDAAWLEERVAANKPDLVCIGPVYKLHAGDDNDAAIVRRVQDVLDGVRRRYGCAWLFETHAPKESFKRGGKLVIAASRLWTQWPDAVIGLVLNPKNQMVADVIYPRPPRLDPNWPHQLWRGGAWPWEDREPPGLQDDAF